MNNSLHRVLTLFVSAAIAGSVQGQDDKPIPPAPALFVMDADGKNLMQLPSPPEYDGQGSPVWSADGKKIGFDAWRASVGESFRDCHVFVSSVDGSNPRDLGNGAMPSFSRDGTQITFSRYSPNQGVWTMRSDGSEKKMLDANGWGARWSPDGRSIAYTVYNGGVNIEVYDVETETRKRILDAKQSGRYRQIYWSFCFSPDSKQVCFKALSNDADQPYEAAVANVDGNADGFRVIAQRSLGNKFSWHPDGKQIVFSLRDPMRKLDQLYLVPADKKAEPKAVNGQPFDRANTGPDWSPDGKRIVFSSREVKRN